MDPSPGLATWALLIALSRRSTPASVKAFTVLSPCHPLGQSGSARPPCLTTSGGDSETPSQRLHQPNHPRSAVGGITVCYGTCLQSPVSLVRSYHQDCIIFGFSLYRQNSAKILVELEIWICKSDPSRIIDVFLNQD